jgi:hypothetical protein
MAGSRLKDAICVAQTVIDDLKNFNQALEGRQPLRIGVALACAMFTLARCFTMP